MNKEILERAENIFKNQEFQNLTGMKLEKLEVKKSIISCENKKNYRKVWVICMAEWLPQF